MPSCDLTENLNGAGFEIGGSRLRLSKIRVGCALRIQIEITFLPVSDYMLQNL